MDFRKSNLDAFTKKYGIKLGFMSIFAKASAYALQDQPVVNAVIDGNVSKSNSETIPICIWKRQSWRKTNSIGHFNG